jgi:hypothetical protein
MVSNTQASPVTAILFAGAFAICAVAPEAGAQMSGMSGMSGMAGMSGQYRVAPDGSTYLYPSKMLGMGGMSGMGGAHRNAWRTWKRPFSYAPSELSAARIGHATGMGGMAGMQGMGSQTPWVPPER